jgi:hypothetical protein
MGKFWLVQSILRQHELPYLDKAEWIEESDDRPPDVEFDLNGGDEEQIICIGGPYETWEEAETELDAYIAWSMDNE